MNRAPGPDSDTRRRGFAFGIAAYGLWGVLPVYFKAIDQVSPVDIVAHRILWSLPFLALLLTVAGGWDKLRSGLRSRRTLLLLLVTSLLIATNWLLYVYAVTTGRILAGSLGYYLNPLANVLLGRIVLKEKLGPLHWAAVAIAAAGILPLAAQAADQLWLSLTLCFSFATYGLLRKIAPVDSVAGLTVETALLLPLSAAWLLFNFSGSPAFGTTTQETALLLLAGVISTTPLLLFTAAARRLPYSTLGMLQFLAPSLQFAIAVGVYSEPFTVRHAIAFGAIWTALALYITASLREPRVPQPPE